MTQTTQPRQPRQPHAHGKSATGRVDTALVLTLATLALVAILSRGELVTTIKFAATSLMNTSVGIIFAVLAFGYLTASGAETILARAFEGREMRMILLAALFGGLSPFCSCEVIPFIAALLAIGAPLSAVMAFWLASPLMDPAMFLITAGSLGTGFAVAKTVAAVSLGLFGGFGVRTLAFTQVFADPLKPKRGNAGCCGNSGFSGTPRWAFWREPARMAIFRRETLSNGVFLVKWLLLAYVLEAVMVRFIPAVWIGQTLGGDGLRPIFLGALFGGPAYLNGYAAVPLIAGMIKQGMSQGAAMSFVLAGGVSCMPAAVAVWALVKPRVCFASLGFAFSGSVIAGFIWALVQ